MCIDIVEIWFGIANGQILSIFAGYYCFHCMFIGYGVLIKTAVGRTLINMTNITNNWGDGIKMYVANYTINHFNRDFPAEKSFCRTPSTSNPSFPILIHEDLVDPLGDKPIGQACSKVMGVVDMLLHSSR